MEQNALTCLRVYVCALLPVDTGHTTSAERAPTSSTGTMTGGYESHS
jgi:hypothetical protein